MIPDVKARALRVISYDLYQSRYGVWPRQAAYCAASPLDAAREGAGDERRDHQTQGCNKRRSCNQAKADESGMKLSEFVRSAALGKRLPTARQSVAIADAEAVEALTMALSALRRMPQTEPVVAAQVWIEARIAPIAPL